MLSFENLYESYAAQVYRFALWLSGDRTEAQDIVSDTFIRAWARSSTIRTETLRAYLLAIARNVYLERLRKHKREVALVDVHSDPAPGPERQTQVRLDLQDVQAVLRTLPEIDRSAFVLRVQYELPYAEIARVLDLSLSAAKAKVHRVRRILLTMRLDKEVSCGDHTRCSS
jgi:RNA polymerase sigma-70 factor (ECF subfamily)